MLDPTRIPAVLHALQRTWEGQPDLSLPTLFGILANRGIGWGATDEDLVVVLAELERAHPGVLPLIDARVTSRYLLRTQAPAHRITIDPFRMIVRRERTSQPGSWAYSGLRPSFVGGPLVVSDEEGIDHRLGVITQITLLDDAPAAEVADLSGVQRRDLGNEVYLLVLAGGETVLLSHRIDHFVAGRRSVSHEPIQWEKLLACRSGAPVEIQVPGGGESLKLNEVEKILVVDGDPQYLGIDGI